VGKEKKSSAKNNYNLNKFIAFAFSSSAIRASFICNNLGIYTQAFSPTIDESAAKVSSVSTLDYLRDIAKVFFNLYL